MKNETFINKNVEEYISYIADVKNLSKNTKPIKSALALIQKSISDGVFNPQIFTFVSKDIEYIL